MLELHAGKPVSGIRILVMRGDLDQQGIEDMMRTLFVAAAESPS